MKLQIKPLSDKIGDSIPLPYYATAGAAALDLHACIDEPAVLPAGGEALIRHTRGLCGRSGGPQQHGHPPRRSHVQRHRSH